MLEPVAPTAANAGRELKEPVPNKSWPTVTLNGDPMDLRFAEGSSARRTRSGPGIGVRDWNLPCRSTETTHGGHISSSPTAKWLEDWRWTSYNNLGLDNATVAVCPNQLDDVRLPLGHRA